MKVMVVPSCREQCFREFLDAWEDQGDWDLLLLTEDSPQKTFDVDIQHHYSWAEIDTILGSDSWIISHRDSAIRSFAFWLAWKLGADEIGTLDDDCYPDGEPFFATHLKSMNSHTRWVETAGMRTRGIPYQNRGFTEVKLNMGGWHQIPDLDGIQSLSNIELATNGDFRFPSHKWIVPNGVFYPMCGMNLCWRRELTPLMYFGLQGEGYEFRRYDDMWSGVIMKRITDHLKINVSVGPPHINHQRASNPFDNLIKEASGVKANENFWMMIDEIPLKSDGVVSCMKEIGVGLEVMNRGNHWQKLGRAIQVWSDLF